MAKILSVAFFVSFLIPSVSFSQDFTTGLVGYWPFCGCSTNDESGNGHDGTLMSGPQCSAGIMDQAFEFDGNNWITVPYSSAFNMNPDSSFTLAAWVNPSEVDGDYHALVVKGTDFWDYGLYIDISNAFMFGCNWPNHETFSTTIPVPGTWYHVVGVYNDRDWKIYVNGTLEDELSNGAPCNQSTNPIGMAIKGNFFKDMYEGSIDEVRLYNRALSAADVLALYQWRGTGLLALAPNAAQLSGNECTPADTTISFDLGGCGVSSVFTLDSVWIAGSSAFQVINSETVPRSISMGDSIRVQYIPNSGSGDSAYLHFVYQVGSTVQDTSIQLIGISSPLLTQTQQLHRESASGYVKQVDTLMLGVDINSSVNLDSLWPHITSIEGSYTWDSAVVKYDGYSAPSGWALTSLSSFGDSVVIQIQNTSGTPENPLDLGTALFVPASNQLATTWVELPSLVMNVSSQSFPICVTDNEDNHWAVKTLGVLSGVGEAPVTLEKISIYPNPAENEIFIENPYDHPLSITIYDEIGRTALTATASVRSTVGISLEPLTSGSYLMVFSDGVRVVTQKISKMQ